MGKESKIEKAKIVTVKRIKEIEPLGEVFQLSPYYRYIITVESSKLVGGPERTQQKAMNLLKMCNQAGIPAAIMIADPDIKFYGFEEAKIPMPKAEDSMIVGGDE